MNMKTLSLIGLIVAIVLAVALSSGGLATSQTLDTLHELNLTNKIPTSGEAQVTLKTTQVIQDDAIFSWPTVVFLGVAVIGIVAFRRNTFI